MTLRSELRHCSDGPEVDVVSLPKIQLTNNTTRSQWSEKGSSWCRVPSSWSHYCYYSSSWSASSWCRASSSSWSPSSFLLRLLGLLLLGVVLPGRLAHLSLTAWGPFLISSRGFKFTGKNTRGSFVEHFFPSHGKLQESLTVFGGALGGPIFDGSVRCKSSGSSGAANGTQDHLQQRLPARCSSQSFARSDSRNRGARLLGRPSGASKLPGRSS